MVVYYDEVMCHAEKLVHHLQCQGHSEGVYNQNMTIFYQTWWYSNTSLSVQWENGIIVLKVKVTAKVQNVSECLSGQYLLNHRTFCRQTWYGYAAS